MHFPPEFLFVRLLFNGIFANGNFSWSYYAMIAAVYNLVWEINELAWSCGQLRMPWATQRKGFLTLLWTLTLSSNSFMLPTLPHWSTNFKYKIVLGKDKQYGFLLRRVSTVFCFCFLISWKQHLITSFSTWQDIEAVHVYHFKIVFGKKMLKNNTLVPRSRKVNLLLG